MTDFAALDALSPLPPEDLFRQWVLSPDPAEIPEQWERRSLHGWWLAAHPDAHICTLRAVDGTAIGWIIEPLVQLRPGGGGVPGDEVVLAVAAQAGAAELERALYGRDDGGTAAGHGVEGSWVAIILGGAPTDPLQRVYLGASHSVVFAPEHRVVATSHNLVPDVTRDLELSRAFDPLATKSYFTFGLTSFVGLHRLLPNHYLDLVTFEAVRHWPRRAFESLSSGEEGAAAIVDHSRRILDVLSADHAAFKVFLSAGYDSRAVLAMLRPLVEAGVDVLLATGVGRDIGSRVDLRGARRLAEITGLEHHIIQRRLLSSETTSVTRAFVRIGEARAGSTLSKPGLSDGHVDVDTDVDRLTLAGMAGGVGRGVLWAGRDLPEHVLPVELLVQRVRSPVTGVVVAAAERWLAGLPEGLRPAEILDLAYIEQRLGGWESVSRYLIPVRRRGMSPMTAARNLETMLRLPEPYRAAGGLQRDMIRYGWPELLQVPFNTATGMLRVERDLLTVRNKLRRRLLSR